MSFDCADRLHENDAGILAYFKERVRILFNVVMLVFLLVTVMYMTIYPTTSQDNQSALLYMVGCLHSDKEPIPTITAGDGHFGEVRAFLIKYYSQGVGQDIKGPLDTVTALDRFGLVTIDGVDYQIVDNTGALSADLRKSKILQ